jgi:hypothetical protein
MELLGWGGFRPALMLPSRLECFKPVVDSKQQQLGFKAAMLVAGFQTSLFQDLVISGRFFGRETSRLCS